MSFSKEIKELRRQCLLTQDAFAEEIGVSHSTVNRWETGKMIPNYKTMQKLKEFCEKRSLDFSFANNVWKNSV